MKKYLLTAALAVLAASPALAASQHRAVNRAATANEAYAAVQGSDAVYDNGKYLGADPDPAIRQDLLRQGDQSEIGGQ